MKRKLILVAVLCAAAFGSGCALFTYDFQGNRSINFETTILGNNLKWSSTVDGAYSHIATDTELARNLEARQPASVTTTTTVTTVQAK